MLIIGLTFSVVINGFACWGLQEGGGPGAVYYGLQIYVGRAADKFLPAVVVGFARIPVGDRNSGEFHYGIFSPAARLGIGGVAMLLISLLTGVYRLEVKRLATIGVAICSSVAVHMLAEWALQTSGLQGPATLFHYMAYLATAATTCLVGRYQMICYNN